MELDTLIEVFRQGILQHMLCTGDIILAQFLEDLLASPKGKPDHILFRKLLCYVKSERGPNRSWFS